MRREFFGFFIPLWLLSIAGFHYAWVSLPWVALTSCILGVGLFDVLQRRHTVLRNFPVVGHIRYLFEMLRPEMQQYFIEADVTGDPIARIYRSVVYQRSKLALQSVPFGSQLDHYAPDYQWVNHSTFPRHLETSDFRVKIGGEHCRQPYAASLFNVSGMSYGSISKAAVRALSYGAAKSRCYLNTGEGGLSPYHLEGGADLVFQIGTAYFGCRDEHGYFSEERFAEVARHPQVKMIELKISQGAKPGHGGVLPAVKVTEEIAEIRRVPLGQTVNSPPYHTAFRGPLELCAFLAKLRELSDFKPVGFKFCLGKREEFIRICDAMLETGIAPDFITIDGGEGGTGAAPFEFINFVGSPLNEALFFVDATLEQKGLRDRVKIIASGKVFTAFEIFEKLALGADLCNSARGMMLALGCIQALRCHTNNCPTGITTNRKRFYRGLDVPDKSERVASYHHKTMEAFRELLGAAGLEHPDQIQLSDISRRERRRVVDLGRIYGPSQQLSPHERTAGFEPRHDPTPAPQLPTH